MCKPNNNKKLYTEVKTKMRLNLHIEGGDFSVWNKHFLPQSTADKKNRSSH